MPKAGKGKSLGNSRAMTLLQRDELEIGDVINEMRSDHWMWDHLNAAYDKAGGRSELLNSPSEIKTLSLKNPKKYYSYQAILNNDTVLNLVRGDLNKRLKTGAPPLIVSLPQGYIVMDGNHRLIASIIAGKKTIKAQVIQP